MKAGKYDITIEQGAGFSLPITFKPGGLLVDWTGYTARLQVRPKVGATAKLIELTTENNGIDMDGPNGKLTLVMSAVATAALKFARAVYDLEIVPPTGEPYRLLEGLRVSRPRGDAVSSNDTQVIIDEGVITVGEQGPPGPSGVSTPATSSAFGGIKLGGDIAGPADAPTVPGLGSKQPLDIDLTAIAGLTPANDDFIQRKAGAWINRTPAQVKTDLALTKADVGLSAVPNVDATDWTNHVGTQPSSTISDFSAAADARIAIQKGFASGIATLDSGGKIPSSQLPAIPESAVTNLTTDLAAKAPLASPVLTGTPTAPTASAGTANSQIATTDLHGRSQVG